MAQDESLYYTSSINKVVVTVTVSNSNEHLLSTYGLGTFLSLWGYSFIGLESEANILQHCKFTNEFIDKETKT